MEPGKISVWLDNRRSDELKRFHCPQCGKVVFEYFNDAKIMMPGEMGEAKKSPIVIQCNGAISEYRNGIQVNTRCHTKVWVE